MTARDEILTGLKAKKRAISSPAPWKSRRAFPDLAKRFLQSVTNAGGEAYLADDLDSALVQVGELFADLQPGQVVVDGGVPLDQNDFQARWPEVTWNRVPTHGVSDRAAWQAICAQADVGVSGADAALAETGTVVLRSGPGRSRLVTLLPPIHLALVSVDCLQPDLFTWTAARSGSMPAGVTLVSGPSKTGDIEQTLSIGVHGPKHFIVVLYK